MRVRGDDVAQQRLRAILIDGKVIIDEKDCDLSAVSFGAFFQQQQLVDDTLVRAKTNYIAKEPSDGAELAAVRTAAPGLHRDGVEIADARSVSFSQAPNELRNEIKLIQIDRVPGDYRIRLQAGFLVFARFIDRRVSVFQFSAHGVLDNLRPGLIGLSQGNSVDVARPAVSAQSFIRLFGHMWAAHNHGNAGGANGVRHPVGFLDHARHRADAHQTDVLLLDEFDELLVVHPLRVPVDQDDLMSRRRQCLKQKHPQVRHEIARHAVIRIVQKNFHLLFPET